MVTTIYGGTVNLDDRNTCPRDWTYCHTDAFTPDCFHGTYPVEVLRGGKWELTQVLEQWDIWRYDPDEVERG